MEGAWDTVVLIGVDVLVLAALFATTAAGAGGRLKRNALAGIRTPATMRDDAAWRAGHAAALPTVRVLCVLVALGAIVAGSLLAGGLPGAAFAVALTPLFLVIPGALWVARVAGAAARAASPDR